MVAIQEAAMRVRRRKYSLISFAVILCLLLAVPRCFAGIRKMSVAQLENLIAANAGKSDSSLADKIYEVDLTEQLSDARLVKDLALLPGEHARNALTAVADIAVFLPLPKEDQLNDDAPDAAAQSAMLTRMHHYAADLIPTLPNFFATRTIKRFVDWPYQAPRNPRDSVQYVPLNFAGTSIVTVLYRKGHEVIDAGSAAKPENDKETSGLSTEGTFGPLLQTIMRDSAGGTLSWSHWEMRNGRRIAVFAYQVPATSSNYEIQVTHIDHPELERPAYHGEIHFDAETGTIFRLTMVAEFAPDDLYTLANTMVDYGQVEIGGKEFYCPVKSVAVSKIHIQIKGEIDSVGIGWRHETWGMIGPPQLRVNDMRFSDYHQFRVESEILTTPVEQK